MSSTCRHCGLPLSADNGPHEGDGFCCFGCSIADEIVRERSVREEGSLTPMHVRIAIAIIFAMSVMTFSLVSYADFIAPDASADPATQSFSQLYSYLAFVFSVPVLVLLGGPMLKRLRDRQRGHSVWLEVLVLAGISAAFVLSAVNLIRGEGHTYFETVVITLLLWSLGRYTEALVRTRAMLAVRDAAAASERPCLRILPTGADPEEVTTQSLRLGDVIRLRAGDVAPIDGRIVCGAAFVDESVTTGEPVPVSRASGDFVAAGARVVDASIDIRLTSDPRLSSLTRLAEAVRTALGHRGRISLAAERASRFLVLGTLIIGFATFAWWLAQGDLEAATLNTLSVWLVACPCSLGIAVPLVAYFALQRARQRGVLFRSSEALERAATISKLFLDKTGTLTTSLPEFEEFLWSMRGPVNKDEAWAAVVGIQRESQHPLAQAIVTSSAGAKTAPAKLQDCRTIPGAGMQARIDGIEGDIRIGSGDWLRSSGIEIPEQLAAEGHQIESQGGVVSLLAVGQRAEGLLRFREGQSHGTLDALEQLDHLCPEIITGARSCDPVFRRWPVRLGQSPDQKTQIIADAKSQRHRVAMVGDGLNDATALATADLSVAACAAQDVNRISADAQLLRTGIVPLVSLFRIAKLARRRMWENILWSVAYNLIGVALAVTGYLHPAAAAGLMFGSSLFVLWNSARWANS
jgi:Cu2+-exporting ATPase